ncbi:MAG: U32 family peptidase [Tannerellaceae bacterium]|jgi:putative protease|nr:U32 family peptidase [Tannerellaceae bacterium]
MAPAGSPESLMAAIRAGADSVYFGVEHLNMRAHAAHARFSIDDLPHIADTCRAHHVRSYLTLNTVLYDQDTPLMRRIVDAACQAGIDALIAADVAVMQYALTVGLPIHLSTQLNIANFEALRFYARFADVAVLARELNLEQVRRIHRQIIDESLSGPSGNLLRLEMFVHGALCMAVSGKCYLSLHAQNRSANRGDCLQICRRGYTVTDRDTGNELLLDGPYIMSPKDLKTIRFLDRMVEAGVTVFKIEGRARGPEYVATVTASYRQALDAYRDGLFEQAPFDAWDQRLSTVFNRGFWDGYYLGQPLGEWSQVYGSAASQRKVYLARAIKYFSHLGVAEFEMEADCLHVGDQVLVTGPTTGAFTQTVPEIRVDLLPVDATRKGERFSLPTSCKIRPSDRLYKLETLTR